MNEANTYICYWRKSKKTYLLNLRDTDISITGSDFNIAKQDICEKIIAWNGDGEAILEMIKVDGKGKVLDEGKYISISYNESVALNNFKEVYNNYCSKCKFAVGKRNDTNLSISRIPESSVVGIDRMLPYVLIYSHDFINTLNRNDYNLFDIRDVYCNEIKTNYYELIPKTFIKEVGYKYGTYEYRFNLNSKCTECNRIMLSTYSNKLKDDIECYSSSEISTDMFFVENALSVTLAMKKNRWLEIVQNMNLKGLISDEILLIDNEEIINPKLHEPKKYDFIM